MGAQLPRTAACVRLLAQEALDEHRRRETQPLDELMMPSKSGSDKIKGMKERVIFSDPDIMNGMPCFRGTRVPFKDLIDYLEGGHSLGEFLRQFPTITREMAVQSLEKAKDCLLSQIA